MAENKDKQVDELEALKAENASLKQQVADQEAIIKGQAEELAKMDEEVKNSGKFPVFEVKGKSYDLVTPRSKTRFDGKMVEVTAKSLKEDQKLLEYCVKSGFAILEERKKGGE